MPVPATTTPSAIDATAPHTAPSGRLGVLTSFAVAASVLPIPIVPDRLIDRVRGAIAQDTVARHGLSLTTEARAILAAPSSLNRAMAIKAAEMLITAVLRRLGPLRAAVFIARGFETFALGLLLERYLSRSRSEGGVRIQADEARRLRSHVDRALLRALSPTLHPAIATLPGPVEDVRDELTRWTDAALLTAASLPSYIERRLEAAFDQVLSEAGEHVG